MTASSYESVVEAHGTIDPAQPRNSFFIFRCEYTQKHAQANKGSNRSPTPEKTLSKRAGVVWNQMTREEKQPYVQLAKQESREHAARNPGYKYKPLRVSEPRRRTSTSVSRREQVESLVQMRERSRDFFVSSHAVISEPRNLLAAAVGLGDSLEIWDWAAKKKMQAIGSVNRWAAANSSCPSGLSTSTRAGDCKRRLLNPA